MELTVSDTMDLLFVRHAWLPGNTTTDSALWPARKA
jgi:hypothetical protein